MQIKCDKIVNVASNQFYENKELSLEGAKKVISVQAFARTNSSQSGNGEIKIDYSLSIRAVYLTEDGLVEKRESRYELNNAIRANINVGDFSLINTSVIGVEHHGLERLKVRVMLEQKGFFVKSTEVLPLDDESLAYKKESKKASEIMPMNSTEIVLGAEEKVKERVGEILSADATIILKKVSCATDICEIDGKVNVYYTYLNGGEIFGQVLSFPFQHELLVEGIREGDVVRLEAIPTLVTLNVEELDEGAEVSAQVLSEVRGCYERSVEIEYPVDAYSKDFEVALHTADMTIDENACSMRSNERFSASLDLDEVKDALEVVSIGAPWVGACNLNLGQSLSVDGVVCAEVILKRESGEYTRIFAEIPYTFDLGDNLNCTGSLFANVVVSSFNAKVRFGATLEVSGELQVEINGREEKVATYLVSSEVLGERVKNDAVISLYLVGEGETLFDCAKALQSDEEELLALNPDLDLPLKAGDKVLLYRP